MLQLLGIGTSIYLSIFMTLSDLKFIQKAVNLGIWSPTFPGDRVVGALGAAAPLDVGAALAVGHGHGVVDRVEEADARPPQPHPARVDQVQAGSSDIWMMIIVTTLIWV